MNTENKWFATSQYVCVPYVAAAYFAHDDIRGAGFPYFHLNIHREGDTIEYLEWNSNGTGETHAISVRAGNWLLVIDRPRGGAQDAPNAPITGSKFLWATLGGPAVALLAIVGGLTKGLFAQLVGSRERSHPAQL